MPHAAKKSGGLFLQRGVRLKISTLSRYQLRHERNQAPLATLQSTFSNNRLHPGGCPRRLYTSRTSLGLLRPGGHNSIHASISNGLAIVLIDMSKDPQVDPSDRRLLAEEIRGSVEFGSC